ncbi:LysR family transcriptional regulator [Labrys neptuniae]|uniref:LysR family transcriptional regulator n=1 Tax=Labrys TaxID=204476 RepID=UPI00288FF014|nr:LysR family transcriptional regulator [Labrys neptuniae]MDT3381239.1 LysR family transcriptional regulator [Labrys neptuniae]
MTVSDSALQRPSPNWDDYRYVRAVAETKSLVGAATALGVNHSTVFRRINAVEELLGARLFERGRSGYALTAAGEEMVALAGRMADDISGFERRVAGRDVKPSGELRVTTNDSIMAHLTMPVFTSFLTSFPDIRLDVVVSNLPLNLSKRDADVAIRATSAPPDTLVGRRVCTIAWAIYGPERLKGAELADLFAERWIATGEGLSNIPPARWVEREVPNERIVMRLNTILGVAEALRSGFGVGLLPCYIGDALPLPRLSEPLPGVGAGLWLLTHPDLKHSAKVRAFMDHGWEALTKLRPVLEGTAEV